ncbi:MAG TPA: hypothetical protein O0X01_02940, partial [Methanocorpusculum sp.]|nr:hypothetical protein [Methanocorpusculum sp.]
FARIIWLYLSKPKYILANVADLVEVLPGKCKLYESLANRKIDKDEYPERVDGPAESDAAYGAGSSISDPTGIYAKARVCYIPEPSGLSGTNVIEMPAPVPAPVSISGEQAPIVDSFPIIDADDESVSYTGEENISDIDGTVVREDDVSEPEFDPEVSSSADSELPDYESLFDNGNGHSYDIHAPFSPDDDISYPPGYESVRSRSVKPEVSPVEYGSYNGEEVLPSIYAPVIPEEYLSEPEPSPSSEPEVSEDEPGSDDGEDDVSNISAPLVPEEYLSEPDLEPEVSFSSDDSLYYSGEDDISDIPTPVVPEDEPSSSDKPMKFAVPSAPADKEDDLFDIHAQIVSDEDRFGPPEQKPEPLFEVDADKELSSFDLYADEPTQKTSSKKKQL